MQVSIYTYTHTTPHYSTWQTVLGVASCRTTGKSHAQSSSKPCKTFYFPSCHSSWPITGFFSPPSEH